MQHQLRESAVRKRLTTRPLRSVQSNSGSWCKTPGVCYLTSFIRTLQYMIGYCNRRVTLHRKAIIIKHLHISALSTVFRDNIWSCKWSQLGVQFILSILIILYIFRATMCPSSGETIVFMRHSPSSGETTVFMRHSPPSGETTVFMRHSPSSGETTVFMRHGPSSGETTVFMRHSLSSGETTVFMRHSPSSGETTVSHKHRCFSWWWTHSCPKHVEINKCTKNNCAPSWLYLQDYTGMQFSRT